MLPELLLLKSKNMAGRLRTTFVGGSLVGFGLEKRILYTLMVCHSQGFVGRSSRYSITKSTRGVVKLILGGLLGMGTAIKTYMR